jgi:hypothetical protein
MPPLCHGRKYARYKSGANEIGDGVPPCAIQADPTSIRAGGSIERFGILGSITAVVLASGLFFAGDPSPAAAQSAAPIAGAAVPQAGSILLRSFCGMIRARW